MNEKKRNWKLEYVKGLSGAKRREEATKLLQEHLQKTKVIQGIFLELLKEYGELEVALGLEPYYNQEKGYGYFETRVPNGLW